jgi:hypothetical protein
VSTHLTWWTQGCLAETLKSRRSRPDGYGGYAHAKQFKRLKRVVKRRRTILCIVIRDVRRRLLVILATGVTTSTSCLLAQDVGTHFIFRTCADRLVGDGTYTVETYMPQIRCKGLHKIGVRDNQSRTRRAVLELKYCRVQLLPHGPRKSIIPR